MTYLEIAITCSLYMTLLWALRSTLRNDGLVDFGWPSSFTAIAIFFYFEGNGAPLRKTIFCSLYVVCGLRFMLGWLYRTISDGEDRRWGFWRQKWQAGEGWLGIKNIAINFLAFYQAQNLSNIFVLMVPLYLAAANPAPTLHPLEIAGLALWLVSFTLENIADLQLFIFKRKHPTNTAVLRIGLWRYSRHPNYFFELLIWVSYALFAWPSAHNIGQQSLLVTVPVLAYWFLAHFTGVPMLEKASLEKRGELYRRYLEETNRFFPGPSRSKG